MFYLRQWQAVCDDIVQHDLFINYILHKLVNVFLNRRLPCFYSNSFVKELSDGKIIVIGGIHAKILEIAGELAKADKQFGLQQFTTDIDSDKVIESFRKDLQEIAYRRISRFPTLEIKTAANGIVISGCQPYEILSNAISKVIGTQMDQPINADEYKCYCPSLTKRELQEVAN